MNLNKYVQGSKFIHYDSESELNKKNIVSKKEKNMLISTYLLSLNLEHIYLNSYYAKN